MAQACGIETRIGGSDNSFTAASFMRVSYRLRLSERNDVAGQWLGPATVFCPCIHQLTDWFVPLVLAVINARHFVHAFSRDVAEHSFDIARLETQAPLVIRPRTEGSTEAMDGRFARSKKTRQVIPHCVVTQWLAKRSAET